VSRSDGVAVDIGIPTLGASPFLADAVESVLMQTFTSWRLTISENGAPSAEVQAALARYLDDPRIRHEVVGDLLSMSGNWSRALEGDAPYLALLHDDDRWDEEFLARRVAFLEAHRTCGFAFGGARLINESGEVIGTIEPSVTAGVIAQDVFLPLIYEACIVQPPTVVIRREAYEAVGPFREVFHTDHEMWIRLAAYADVGYLPVADAEYRYHDTQATTQSRTRIGAAQVELVELTSSLPIEPSVRKRTAAKAHLLAAFDCVELGERRAVMGHLQAAVRARPLLFLRPSTCARTLFALAAVAFGERGRRLFTRWRNKRFLGRTGR
jgi:hypothetical protein